MVGAPRLLQTGLRYVRVAQKIKKKQVQYVIRYYRRYVFRLSNNYYAPFLIRFWCRQKIRLIGRQLLWPSCAVLFRRFELLNFVQGY